LLANSTRLRVAVPFASKLAPTVSVGRNKHSGSGAFPALAGVPETAFGLIPAYGTRSHNSGKVR